MHSSGSFLYTCLDRIRGYLDDPDFDAKYDNDFIIRHIITPVMVDVWSRINMNLDNPVVLRHDMSLTTTDEYYQLPPSIGEIWRLARRNKAGDVIEEIMPRNEFHVDGLGWAIEGNTLRVDPKVGEDRIFTLYYVPSGDIMPHYSVAGELQGDRQTMKLGAATLGSVDRRENAYAGQILRMIPDTGKVEERVIESHDVDLGEVVTRIPFNSTASTGVKYEIAPTGMQSLYESIATGGALKLGTYRKITGTHFKMIQMQYRAAIKSATDNLANMQMRVGKHYEKKTIDNPAYGEIHSLSNWGSY